MKGVTICDKSPDGRFLAVELKDLLAIIASSTDTMLWKLSNVEATGVSREALHWASDRGEYLTTAYLAKLASEVDQIIDGVFEAIPVGENDASLRIEAIDSSAYDFYAKDPELIALVRNSFDKVIDIPNETDRETG